MSPTAASILGSIKVLLRLFNNDALVVEVNSCKSEVRGPYAFPKATSTRRASVAATLTKTYSSNPWMSSGRNTTKYDGCTTQKRELGGGGGGVTETRSAGGMPAPQPARRPRYVSCQRFSLFVSRTAIRGKSDRTPGTRASVQGSRGKLRVAFQGSSAPGGKPKAALTKKFPVSNSRIHYALGQIRGPGVPETNWDRPPKLDDIPYRHRPADRETPEFCPTDSAPGAKRDIGSSGAGARRLPR